jgi:hypothetical protein
MRLWEIFKPNELLLSSEIPIGESLKSASKHGFNLAINGKVRMNPTGMDQLLIYKCKAGYINNIIERRKVVITCY